MSKKRNNIEYEKYDPNEYWRISGEDEYPDENHGGEDELIFTLLKIILDVKEKNSKFIFNKFERIAPLTYEIHCNKRKLIKKEISKLELFDEGIDIWKIPVGIIIKIY